METAEEYVLRFLRLEFIRKLVPSDYVLDYLEQEGALTDLACEHIRSKASRQEQATCLLDYVTKKAIIPLFVLGLEFKNSHKHLANLYSKKLSEVRYERQARAGRPTEVRGRWESSGNSSSFDDPDATELWTVWTSDRSRRCTTTRSPHGQNRSTSSFGDLDARTIATEEEEHADIIGEDGEGKVELNQQEDKSVICMQPARVRIMDSKKKVLTQLHYHFKLLSHDGKNREFCLSLSKYKSSHGHDPDVMFTLLDADVERRRVVFDTRLHKGSIFDEMEKLLPKCSQPIASTMTFIARKGSARTMKENLEVGLEMLEEARALSERIHPCKDTGIVLYIQINLLIQAYEKQPTHDKKQSIIAKIDECINVHFAEEPLKLREDYTRMLYLKMAFTYLGMGLFGSIIDRCVVSAEDQQCAKACFQIIDSFPGRLESRRRMLYCMAKSVLLQRGGLLKEAREMALKAKEIAQEGGFLKELRVSIIDRNNDLTREVSELEAHEQEEREKCIDKELSSLGLDREGLEFILQKPSNQWGDDSRLDNSLNQTPPTQFFKQSAMKTLYLFLLAVVFMFMLCMFIT